MSDEEIDCEKHYQETHTRTESGRYVVRLPFKTNTFPLLGKSKFMAEKRLMAMERRFEKIPHIKKEYIKFMDEYSMLQHMTEENSTNDNDNNFENSYYLPHHAVIKESSTTTKLRVVFDASCPSSTGVSLNNKMMIGPTIQNELIYHLLNFRKNKIAFTADIAKIYRQILVNENDQRYQKILWRKDSGDMIKEYKLTTITYGTAAAPFLAIRTLKQLAIDEGDGYPSAKK